ncbi:PGN_0703 family putative restriction endonuclease [Bradyrhizobium sp.]|uniref:PGN_0703 family putative restriction endonuclease n=1 Tax=Bradyrhizobium sp. TaxID=376 RepID=UPI004037EFE2
MSNSIPSSEPTASDSTAPATAAPGPNSSDATKTVAHANTARPTKSTSTIPGHQAGRPPRENTGKHAFVQLARTPLVPEKILKEHGAFCVIDTRFRAAARLLQCLWLRDHDIPAASSDAGDTFDGPAAFGNILAPDAAYAGRNFLSSAIHHLALQEWLMCEEDAAIDDERLFGNALSSMPLVFNMFGPMALDLKLATAIFRELLPGFVRSVERIQFEHSPGRRDERFLADRSAVDLAVRVTTPGGEPGTIFIEVKFSEGMDGVPARMRDRYNEASKGVRLYDNPDSLILRAGPVDQLWREHMLSQLAVDNGITPRAVFLAIGPKLNRRVQGVFRVYQGELIDPERQDTDRVPFIPLTLEAVIEAIATAGATDHAQVLWGRYCDFDRVYRLSLHQLAGDAAPAPADKPAQHHHAAALPPSRRALAAAPARRTRSASSRPRGNTASAKQEAV